MAAAIQIHHMRNQKTSLPKGNSPLGPQGEMCQATTEKGNLETLVEPFGKPTKQGKWVHKMVVQNRGRDGQMVPEFDRLMQCHIFRVQV